MVIGKLAVLAAIVVSIVFGSDPVDRSHQINIHQFEGTWYVMAVIAPEEDGSHDISCYRSNVSRTTVADQHFRQDTKLIIDGRQSNFVGFGNIINSEIRLTTENHASLVCTVTKYHGGDEIILKDEIHAGYYQLLSRWSTVSTSTRVVFEQLATSMNVNATKVKQTECLYKN